MDEDLITLKKLGEEIEKPQILSYIGLDTINIYIPEDRHFMASDMIEYIYQMEKDKVHKTLVRDCLPSKIQTGQPRETKNTLALLSEKLSLRKKFKTW